MEGAREAGSFLDEIKPPRIEDAGLEDCALPPESIRDAFLKAAAAVGSVIYTSDDEDESGADDDRQEDSSDDLRGVKEGVAVGEVWVGDGLKGLEIGEKSRGSFGKIVGGEENGEKERPTN